jgi:hypothetical protein
MPQGLEGAPRDNATHVCTSWCAEQLAAYELELAELRDHVAALGQDGRVGIEAWPSMSSEPTAQPTDLGDGAHGVDLGELVPGCICSLVHRLCKQRLRFPPSVLCRRIHRAFARTQRE